MDATTIAVDVAKTVFEVAIANREWHIVARHRFNRHQFRQFLATASPTHVVMEACGTAHDWGRCAQRHGHTVTLLPPAYVRPYVRRNKTDRTDAEALLEATRSGQIPSVPVKSVAQQTLVALHLRDVHWDHALIEIRRSKTPAGWRSPTLNATCQRVLRSLHDQAAPLGFTKPDHFVFPWHGRAKRIDPTRAMTSWRTAWRSIRKAAG